MYTIRVIRIARRLYFHSGTVCTLVLHNCIVEEIDHAAGREGTLEVVMTSFHLTRMDSDAVLQEI